ncbi:hypothetical protein B0H94_1227 [Salsuginibacillus halophilus]|uniref:Uncharacterized protein n=1 Tax=Salsuginibacillus halophilus TaxID=517424 RepID=A0A2P8H3M5_9BACI|nr:hypothetical protein [Salsuginibacillus halophilus]PSL40817.1 hypothetical protein B0H94_1227 [Salsuginibacillus halophilus]
MDDNQRLLRKIEMFEHMIAYLPDQEAVQVEFKNFFQEIMQLNPSRHIPLCEISALLKVRKPIIFQTLNNQWRHDPALGAIFNTMPDAYKALDTLNQLKSNLRTSDVKEA